ncbi:hypothetical protein [Nonomuraea jabiensis]|uniref:hypothetical protein n=1 Tax=Nonomuraea jabiensis TaxID=882448 RepID=UPI003D71D65E
MSYTCRKCGHENTPIPAEPPMYSVVKDCDGDTWQRRKGGWYLPDSRAVVGCSWESLAEDLSPIEILHFVPEETA